MKHFKDLSPKEIALWEKHIQNRLGVYKTIPQNLLQSFWMDEYKNNADIYHPVFNTKPRRNKQRALEEEHRTVVEDYLEEYYKDELVI